MEIVGDGVGKARACTNSGFEEVLWGEKDWLDCLDTDRVVCLGLDLGKVFCGKPSAAFCRKEQ